MLGYIYHHSFAGPVAEERYRNGRLALPRADPSWFFELDENRTSRRAAVLTAAEEQGYFWCYNYARWRADGRGAGDPDGSWKARAIDVANEIVSHNLPLVLSVIGRTLRQGTPEEIRQECIGECVTRMMRCVELFDFRRGLKFSTYAYRSLANSVYRVLRVSARNREFQPEGDHWVPPTNTAADLRAERAAEVRNEHVDAVRRAYDAAPLTPGERIVVRMRFLWEPRLTLDQVGTILDLTKERIRQIQIVALAKIRGALDGDVRTEYARMSRRNR